MTALEIVAEPRRQGRMRFYRAEKQSMGPLALVPEEHWRRSLDRLEAVELRTTIMARPETVFRFFTDPVCFARWVGGGMGEATIDPLDTLCHGHRGRDRGHESDGVAGGGGRDR